MRATTPFARATGRFRSPASTWRRTSSATGRPRTRPRSTRRSEASRRRFAAITDSQRDVIAGASRAVLALGALGVVYGDIGTSPLYTEQVIFSSYRATAHVTPATAYGVASLIFWALMIVVSIKYAGFIMRAHNRGDRRDHGADGAPAAQSGPVRHGAGHARHLRRRAVLRRRHHHTRDLRPRLDPGRQGRDPGPRAPGRAAVGRDPRRVVRAPAIRLRDESAGCSVR